MENVIGLRIKEFRENKRLSQEYMAACLDVTQSNYGRLPALPCVVAWGFFFD